MKQIINQEKFDFTKEPLFFGKDLGIQRYDIQRYKKLYQLYQQQLEFFWRPEEVNVTSDGGQFKSLSNVEKEIFTNNLKYQILLDSVQSRGIPNLLEHCSNPELEACAKVWEFMETLHSYSYTYIIKNVYSNPSEVFDNLMDDPEIMKRTTSVTKHYDSLINSLKDENIKEAKKKLYLTLVSINILEGIRFYVSFACSYAFAEHGRMEGNAKIISFINRDENLHLAITQNLLKWLANNPDEGFQKTVKDCEETVIQMYKDAATEEMEWAEYLFRDGSMIGLSDKILVRYMKWLTNRRMAAIGLKPVFDKIDNPINWIEKWTSSKKKQLAPQETEIESYRVGSFKHDEENMDFDNFSL
jgi:ribonucleoside-diphosphate reductase beta chain